MSSLCDRRGWGAAGWGTVWGGAAASVGGDLPVLPPFDVYCICEGEAMDAILAYSDVTISPPDNFFVNPSTHELNVINEGGAESQLFINTSVPEDFTLEAVITFDQLPTSITEAETRHIFLGVCDTNGYAAGLLFSKAGLAYLGTYGSAKTLIPDTENVVEDGTTYYIRIVQSHETGAVFIYITSAEELALRGHHLIAIMPVVPYASCALSAEGTWLRMQGTSTKAVQLRVVSLCLSSSVLIVNIPPVADAGPDQAVRTCTIIRLDGSQSMDPEGSALSYRWRLIDAPVESTFCYGGLDGHTVPMAPPTGFTNKLYSTSFGGSSPIPVEVGDVLFIEGEAYDIEAIGTDGFGDYVRIPSHVLPDSWTGKAFKVLKQNGIADPTTVHPAFYPDVQGFYRFDLIVFDGQLYSDPSVTIVNVMENILPRGVIPDSRFLWNYLSDFWALLEDKERIEVTWGSAAQAVATELYTLWQIEYEKSLRDIQRTFIRRWLHYDLLLREPFIDLCTLRVPTRGIDSTTILFSGMAWDGKRFTITLPDGRTKVVTLSGTLVTPEIMAKQTKEALQALDKRFDCIATDELTSGSHTKRVRIIAPFQFTVTQVDAGLPFHVGATNSLLGGSSGFLTGEKTYKTSMCLEGLVAENDLLQVHDSTSSDVYIVRVASVADAFSVDGQHFQRLLLKDPLPLSAGAVWSIPAKATSSQLDFYEGLVTDKDRVAIEVCDDSEETIVYHSVTCYGSCAGIPNAVLFDATDFLTLFSTPSRYSIYFWGVYRRGYMPIESKIVEIPHLQRVIKNPDEREVLRMNLDYHLEQFRGRQCIRFESTVWDPERLEVLLPRLWAEYNYLDNKETVEANFGIPVDFTLDNWDELPSTVDYLSAVRGLWYTYTNGPRISNIRIGTQILLGLPFAEEAGTIEEIRNDFSPTQGRILIRDKINTEIVRTYPYAKLLDIEINPDTGEAYKVGDSVAQFAPLVTGVEVVDYVKSPKWFEGYIKQGLFYEVEKFFKFMVRVNGDIFNLPALLFARQFVRNIKPTYTFPMFVVLRTVDTGGTEIDVSDDVHYRGFLRLEDGPMFVSIYGASCGFDEPDPSPGYLSSGVPTPYSAPGSSFDSHSQSAFDTDSDRSQALPVFPIADNFVRWSFDRNYLCPEFGMWAVTTAVMPWEYPSNPDPVHVEGAVRFDSIFKFDRGVYAAGQLLVFGQQFLLHVPSSWQEVKETVVSGATFWANAVELEIRGMPISGETDFDVRILVNGVEAAAFSFVHSGGSSFWFIAKDGTPIPGMASISPFRINTGDSVIAHIRSTSGGAKRPYWYAVIVTVGALGDVWHFDAGVTNPFPGYPDPTPFPDSTISMVRAL